MSSNNFVCRACMQPRGKNENNEDITFRKLKLVYTELTMIHISEDDLLPKYICSQCSEQLQQFKSFKNSCITSDLNLRKSLVNIKEEVVDSGTFLCNLKVEPLCVFEDEVENETNDSVEEKKLKSDSMSEDEDADYEPVTKPTKRQRLPSDKDCDICYKSFATARGMRKHKRVKHDPANLIKYKCKYCQRVLSTKGTFDMHIQRHEKQNQLSVTNRYDHACLICDKRFQLKESLNGHHKQTHTVYTTLSGRLSACETCGLVFKKKIDMQKHLEMHYGPNEYTLQHKCTLEGCRSLFKRKEDLENHLKCHAAGIPPNVCDICFKPMATEKHKQRHRREKHENNTYKCNFCFKILTNLASYKDHVRRHDITPSRNFVCETCGQAFTMKAILTAHMISHSEVRNFKCNLCGKAFKTSSILLSHTKKTHNSKKVDCLICGHQSSCGQTLYKHCRNMHTVYTTLDDYIFSCKICDSKFKGKPALKKHEKLHTGDRPYVCPLCPQTYAHAALLKRHSYSHSGDFPYNCEVCGKGFVESYKFKMHKNTHQRLLLNFT